MIRLHRMAEPDFMFLFNFRRGARAPMPENIVFMRGLVKSVIDFATN